MKNIFAILLSILLTSGALAHTKVDTTTPPDGAVLTDVPAQVDFSFANEIRLTKVEMAHENHPKVTLDLGDQTRFEREFTLPMQEMGAGTYRIEWRGLGMDGHAMQGEFTFTVE